MENNETQSLPPEGWEKILDAARVEPLPVLAAVVWGLGKILDDRLSEMITRQKTIEAILEDIHAAINFTSDKITAKN